MVRIGLLHHHQNPNEHRLLYDYWLTATAEHADVVYFTPQQIDTKKQVVQGFIYEDGEWRQRETNLPDVIYNLSSYSKIDMSRLHELKTSIPIMNFPLGNWVDLYSIVKRGRFI